MSKQLKKIPVSLLLSAFLLCGSAFAADAPAACADAMLAFGFYAFFEPVSYSADPDPEADDFTRHLGYEADLLSALEAMQDAGLSFSRHTIAQWDEIWLQSASPAYDIVGGGITILDSHRLDADGEELVTFTAGHIAFRQSLLARAEDAERLNSYAKLNSATRVGVLLGTTGEFRLLQLSGLVDEAGRLAVGTRIETAAGHTLRADGSADYFITAADAAPRLSERSALYPPSETLPQVIYLGSELGEQEMLAALQSGEIDAIARGEIGNATAAHNSAGALVVSVVDEEWEAGGFTVALEAADLAACLDERIAWLTDANAIVYAQ